MNEINAKTKQADYYWAALLSLVSSLTSSILILFFTFGKGKDGGEIIVLMLLSLLMSVVFGVFNLIKRGRGKILAIIGIIISGAIIALIIFAWLALFSFLI